jgi:hypothetical protein
VRIAGRAALGDVKVVAVQGERALVANPDTLHLEWAPLKDVRRPAASAPTAGPSSVTRPGPTILDPSSPAVRSTQPAQDAGVSPGRQAPGDGAVAAPAIPAFDRTAGAPPQMSPPVYRAGETVRVAGRPELGEAKLVDVRGEWALVGKPETAEWAQVPVETLRRSGAEIHSARKSVVSSAARPRTAASPHEIAALEHLISQVVGSPGLLHRLPIEGGILQPQSTDPAAGEPDRGRRAWIWRS